MANSNMTPPPSTMGGKHRGLHGIVQKPRDLKGTLLRLWQGTRMDSSIFSTGFGICHPFAFYYWYCSNRSK